MEEKEAVGPVQGCRAACVKSDQRGMGGPRMDFSACTSLAVIV